MKAWVLHGAGNLRLEDIPVPVPGTGEVLLRVKASGICGSDIARVFETGAHKHPLVIGHEFAGIVEAVGKDASPAWRKKKVGVYPLIPCRKCTSCQNGWYELCRDYNYLGSRCNGGFAEYVSVPVRNLMELPEGMSYEEAALLEPLGVAVHALRRGMEKSAFAEESSVVICGFGTIGALIAKCMLAMGHRNMYVIGNKEFQKGKAIAMGILPEHYCDSREKDVKEWLADCVKGADVFFECTGRNEVFSWGVDGVKPMGKMILVGNPCSDMSLEKSVYWKLLRNQIMVTGTWNSSFTGDVMDDWHFALNLIKSRNIRLTELITHRLALEGLADGLRIMRDKKEDFGKVMILI